MISTAKAKYMRISPQKVRMVMDLIRGKNVNQAFNILAFTKKRAAGVLAEVLKSAVANAKQKDEEIDADRLFVSRLFANGGPSQKRFLPRAMGRATEVLKRTSHIIMELDVRAEKKKIEKVVQEEKAVKSGPRKTRVNKKES